MNYLLTSINKTQERTPSLKDYIKMAFKINPKDIRYDSNIPAIDLNLSAIAKELREITIRERVNSFISNIQGSIGGVRLNSIKEIKNNRYEVELIVNEEKLKFKL